MSGIKIEIEGIKDIEMSLDQLQEASSDLHDVLDVIGNYLDSEVNSRFHNSEGPVDGVLEPWLPIKDSTAIARNGGKRKVFRKNGEYRTKGGQSFEDILSSEKPLLHHHHLLDSITHNVFGNTLEHGSGIEYAPFH